MNDPSRIDSLSTVETVPRQTVKNDFGESVSTALSTVAKQGLSLLGGVASSMPILSSAVAGIQSVAGMGHATSLTGVATAGAPAVGGSSVLSGLGGLASSSSSSNTMQGILQQVSSGGDLTPTQYLLLQQSMTEESQQYTAQSNIMKVRSDSAKSAINNIR